MKKKNDTDFNPVLHEQIHDIVENQIKDNDSKETRKTMDRLIKSGYDRHDAIHMIGGAVVNEIYKIMKFKEKFNEERFVKNLRKVK